MGRVHAGGSITAEPLLRGSVRFTLRCQRAGSVRVSFHGTSADGQDFGLDERSTAEGVRLRLKVLGTAQGPGSAVTAHVAAGQVPTQVPVDWELHRQPGVTPRAGRAVFLVTLQVTYD